MAWDSSLVALFALAWALAFTGVALTRVRDALAPASQELRLIVTAAIHEAQARGNERMDHIHLALALTFDPEVAARLGRLGAADALRDRLDAFLREHQDPKDGEVIEVGVPDPDSPVVSDFAASLRGDHPIVSPAQYMTFLVDGLAADPASSPDVHAIFAASGLDPETWRESRAPAASQAATPADRAALAPADPPPSAGPPYRAHRRIAKATGDRIVRFWNDQTTTQALVLELLTGTFGRSPSEARYLMVRTHLLGAADVGPFTKSEAEALVQAALARAHEAGATALRLTVERDATPLPRSFWRRVLRAGAGDSQKS